jgi:hypothetical protein
MRIEQAFGWAKTVAGMRKALGISARKRRHD